MSAENYDYDVLYIGSGHGTFDGAIPLASKGVKVAVVESGLIGGTCPNRGCNAKITLDAPVVLQRLAERLNGVTNGNISINWAKNVEHKDQVIGSLPDAISGFLKSAGIDIFHGFGNLVDAHTVAIEGQGTKTADKIVISTGLRPHRLDIPGTELAGDSEDFMNLKEQPERLVIIGAGYIATEFATIANASGSKVTVLTHGDRALRAYRKEYVDLIIDDLKKRGVEFINNTAVTSFEKTDGGLLVKTASGQNYPADWILDATGRIPNIEKLGLDKAGVKYNKNGVIVNDHLQTSVDNIYASGDVIDKTQPKLTPTAIFESMYLTSLFSKENSDPIDYPAIPSTVFSSPRLAQVGVKYDDAKADPDKYSIKENHLPDDWYRQVDKQTIGDNYLIFDKNDHLVGAGEVSERAEDSINTLLPAIEFKLDSSQLGRLIYLFPSISSATAGEL
ncbi:dihydrolipoyl dehydrogenase family protein [Oenococcus alcoholitolerans]|uniref:dihydrolipoyl dehydrogenase family protein n=1 Tax=Oenococcus alcoholitolerans TaxID=931074 RepID=UPI003F6EF06F